MFVSLLISRSAGSGEYGRILTKSCHIHNGDEFGKILSNSQIDANKLNTWKPAMLVDLTILASVTNLAKFRQIAKCMQIS